AIYYEEMAILVSITNVPGVQPIFRVDCARSRFRVVKIALHDLRTADANLAFLIWTKLSTGCRIDQFHFRVWRSRPDGSVSHLCRISRTTVRHWAGLSHAVALANPAA